MRRQLAPSFPKGAWKKEVDEPETHTQLHQKLGIASFHDTLFPPYRGTPQRKEKALGNPGFQLVHPQTLGFLGSLCLFKTKQGKKSQDQHVAFASALLVKAIGDGSSSGLVDDAKHVHARDGACSQRKNLSNSYSQKMFVEHSIERQSSKD